MLIDKMYRLRALRAEVDDLSMRIWMGSGKVMIFQSIMMFLFMIGSLTLLVMIASSLLGLEQGGHYYDERSGVRSHVEQRTDEIGGDIFNRSEKRAGRHE